MQNLYSINGNPPPSYPIYERLFIFIDSALLDFRVLSTSHDGCLVTSEDAISEDLADFLDDKQESLKQDRNISFRFTNQSRKKTDIGVKLGRGYTAQNRNPFCWIEAKRLPTPNRGKNRDEREYVIVEKENFDVGGGIQRFKEGKHAPDLDYSIMIGYIQDNNTVDYWLSKINTWIKNIDNKFWTNEDCLSRYVSEKCERFISTHSRKSETPITLHHYWIKL
jgi:hypothetical protein